MRTKFDESISWHANGPLLSPKGTKTTSPISKLRQQEDYQFVVLSILKHVVIVFTNKYSRGALADLGVKKKGGGDILARKIYAAKK